MSISPQQTENDLEGRIIQFDFPATRSGLNFANLIRYNIRAAKQDRVLQDTLISVLQHELCEFYQLRHLVLGGMLLQVQSKIAK